MYVCNFRSQSSDVIVYHVMSMLYIIKLKPKYPSMWFLNSCFQQSLSLFINMSVDSTMSSSYYFLNR